jgi:hypothetical protein
MKKTSFSCRLFLSLFFILGVLSCCASPQIKSAIAPKAYSTDPTIGIASNNAFADAIGTELIFYGFKVIERSNLYSLVEEQVLGQTGVLREKELIKAGKILNIDALVFVNTNWDNYNPGKVAAAVVRVVDVQSGQVLASVNYQNGRAGAAGSPADADAKESLVESADRIGKEIAKGFGK